MVAAEGCWKIENDLNGYHGNTMMQACELKQNIPGDACSCTTTRVTFSAPRSIPRIQTGTLVRASQHD
eukprot:5772263-Amphidinium_carterae.1